MLELHKDKITMKLTDEELEFLGNLYQRIKGCKVGFQHYINIYLNGEMDEFLKLHKKGG